MEQNRTLIQILDSRQNTSSTVQFPIDLPDNPFSSKNASRTTSLTLLKSGDNFPPAGSKPHQSITLRSHDSHLHPHILRQPPSLAHLLMSAMAMGFTAWRKPLRSNRFLLEKETCLPGREPRCWIFLTVVLQIASLLRSYVVGI